MSRRPTLLRWQAQDASGACAAELAHRVLEPSALPGVLDRAADDVGDASFVIVRAGAWNSAAWREVWERQGDGHDGAPRLCFALDTGALSALDVSMLRDDRAGFMLDGVDIDTPLSALVSERIEAVRFCPAFVTAAARNLRQGCALDAMLSLARDLGLCSLGDHAVPGGASLIGRGEFDYLPAIDRVGLPARRAEAMERPQSATHQLAR